MKKYSILIVAWKAYLIHVSEFVRYLKMINPNVEISLLISRSKFSVIPDDVKEKASEIAYFDECSNKIKNKLIGNLIDRFCFISSFIRQTKKKYDIVNIHFAKPRLAFAMRWIKKLSNTIVISPWGSDVMRADGERQIQQLTRVYSSANFVTVGPDSEIGRQVIEKFNFSREKMVKLGWGGEFFDYIQESSHTASIEDAKARFGLQGRYVITCGYNTQREQRHEAIIDAIYGVRDKLPENLTLLFPFTYGRSPWSDAYTDSVKKKGEQYGFDVVSVEDHLDMSDLLKLRMATDIFVHIQTTDAGSRCVMEYVACNKKVVHGAWIKYAYLEDNKPSCYFPVDRLENLGACIVKAYHAEVGPLPQAVVTRIMERGWKHKMVLWNNFFESLL